MVLFLQAVGERCEVSDMKLMESCVVLCSESDCDVLAESEMEKIYLQEPGN